MPSPKQPSSSTRHATEDAVVTSALLDMARAATEVGAAWALMGGQALRSYGVPRQTTDLDVLVPVDRARDVALILVERFLWVPLTAEEDSPEYIEADEVTILYMDDPVLFDVQQERSLIALESPLGLPVELLFCQHPVEEAMVERAAYREHHGVTVPVAPLGGVLIVKTKADRSKDVAAIEQTAEHLSQRMMDDAIRWGQELDPGTAEELRSIVAAVRTRRVRRNRARPR